MKSYTKTVEEENDKLREKILDLDNELEKAHDILRNEAAAITVTLRYSLSDFFTDYSTDMLMSVKDEDDALCEVLNHFETKVHKSGEHAWELIQPERVRKVSPDVKPTWTLDYWLYGMRFNWAKIQLHKKKKHFFKIYSSHYDMRNNFRWGLEEWEKQKMLDAIKPSTYLKSRLYLYINESSTLKPMFTPHK